MRICWFIDFFLPHFRGGGQIRLYEIGKRLVQQGHKLDVVTMKHPDIPENEKLEGIHVWHIGPVIKSPPQRTLADFTKFFFAVRKWLKSHNYDVVCAEGFSIIPACLFSKVPVVATVHDVSTGGKDQWISMGFASALAEKLTLKLPKKIITVSNAMRKAIIEREVPPKKVVTVYNAVDAQALDAVPAQNIGKNSIIFIGRFVPHKHVDDLIAAFARVLRKRPDAKLLLVGNGPEEQKLRQLVNEFNIKGKVEFHTKAETEKAVGMLKSAAVLVLPSTREGFGIVLAEAGAVSVPVIAYDIPAVREVVVNKKTGLLVDLTGDALAEAITYLIQHPKKAKAMGVAARIYVDRKFSWEKSTEKIIELLKRKA